MSSKNLKFIRLPKVIEKIAIGRTTVYEKIKTGEFPKPYPLGARAVAWLEEDIDAWIEARITASRLAHSEDE